LIRDKAILKRAQVGQDFMMIHLIDKLRKDDAKTALKKERLEKWHKMITYGLDSDLEHLVLKPTSRSDTHGYNFTNYAKIGLSNFFATNPELFISRLAKGPPPQYRWLAWSFIASKLKRKINGEYERNLKLGRNSKWSNDISKDINRSFP
jgi:hypothetical protein